MSAPAITARVTPTPAWRDPGAPRPGVCRLCDRDRRPSRQDETLCVICAADLRVHAAEQARRFPLGEQLCRMEGAWPLGELIEVETPRDPRACPPTPEWARFGGAA